MSEADDYTFGSEEGERSMSKLTVAELEEQTNKNQVVKQVFKVVTYRDPAHPDVIRKVCPVCGKVFDKYLLFRNGLIGCRKCAFKAFLKRCAQLARDQAPELIEDFIEEKIEEKIEELI